MLTKSSLLPNVQYKKTRWKVLCRNCFEASEHKNHQWEMLRDEGGGWCDCGDRTAWREPFVFCTFHAPSYSAPPQVRPKMIPIVKKRFKKLKKNLEHVGIWPLGAWLPTSTRLPTSCRGSTGISPSATTPGLPSTTRWIPAPAWWISPAGLSSTTGLWFVASILISSKPL